jgi:hypothetical protein
VDLVLQEIDNLSYLLRQFTKKKMEHLIFYLIDLYL